MRSFSSLRTGNDRVSAKFAMGLMLGVCSLVLISKKNRLSTAETPAMQTVRCDPAKVAQPIGPYNLGKIVNTHEGKWLYTSGNIGINTQSKVVSDDVAEQARQSLQNMTVVAETAGFDVNKDCVKTHIYLTEMGDFGKINKECEKVFTGEDTPPRVCIAAHQLPMGVKFEIEGVFYKRN